MREFTEYWIDLPYSWRDLVVSAMTSEALLPAFSIESKIEPLPSWSHGTSFGIGAQGWWLDVRMIIDIRDLPSVRGLLWTCFWNCSRAYWSGIVDQLNFGPL